MGEGKLCRGTGVKPSGARGECVGGMDESLEESFRDQN